MPDKLVININIAQTSTIMSEQFAFDNWEEAAEEVLNTKPTQAAEKTQQPARVPQAQQSTPQQAKQTLKTKIEMYKAMSVQQFQTKFADGQEKKRNLSLGAGKVLKSDKDFSELAKLIGDKISEGYSEEQTVDQDAITTFFQQLMLFLYSELEWVNMFEVLNKIKVLKKARKSLESKLQKEQQRRKNKVEEEIVLAAKIAEKAREPPKDDLFGGAVMMNSKQEEQQRKKKAKQEKQGEKQKQKKPAVAEDDDDDFM